MESQIQASFLAPGDANIGEEHVLAWINDMSTGQPVENAQVSVWKRNEMVR